MLFDEYREICHSFWNNYFNTLDKNIDRIKSTGTPLFPKFIGFMDFGNYFAMELLRAQTKPMSLVQKKMRYSSVDDYFDLFGSTEHRPIISLNGDGNGISQLCLAHSVDIERAKARFPFLEIYPSTLMQTAGSGSVIGLGPDFRSAYLERCAILNESGGLFRSKNILMLNIVSKKMKTYELGKSLSTFAAGFPQENGIQVRGVFTAELSKENVIVASQLQNLYLSRGVHETTIGHFIKEHPEIIKLALKTDFFVYEPFLKIIEDNGQYQKDALNPDLFVRRANGYFDIVDLKLARLDRSNLVKGANARRRFIDYVAEGLAQLASYRKYFDSPANSKYAEDKYNIKINDPNLILVTGSLENANIEELKNALMPYDQAISIIDYDTLVSRFLSISFLPA